MRGPSDSDYQRIVEASPVDAAVVAEAGRRLARVLDTSDEKRIRLHGLSELGWVAYPFVGDTPGLESPGIESDAAQFEQAVTRLNNGSPVRVSPSELPLVQSKGPGDKGWSDWEWDRDSRPQTLQTTDEGLMMPDGGWRIIGVHEDPVVAFDDSDSWLWFFSWDGWGIVFGEPDLLGTAFAMTPEEAVESFLMLVADNWSFWDDPLDGVLDYASRGIPALGRVGATFPPFVSLGWRARRKRKRLFGASFAEVIEFQEARWTARESKGVALTCDGEPRYGDIKLRTQNGFLLDIELPMQFLWGKATERLILAAGTSRVFHANRGTAATSGLLETSPVGTIQRQSNGLILSLGAGPPKENLSRVDFRRAGTVVEIWHTGNKVARVDFESEHVALPPQFEILDIEEAVTFCGMRYSGDDC